MKSKQRDEIEQATYDFVMEEYQSLGEKYHPVTVRDFVALRVRTAALPADNDQAKVRWGAATQPVRYLIIWGLQFLVETLAVVAGNVIRERGGICPEIIPAMPQLNRLSLRVERWII